MSLGFYIYKCLDVFLMKLTFLSRPQANIISNTVFAYHIAKVCEWEKNSISFFGCSAEMDIEGVTKILRSLKIFDERKNFSIKK
jgi:hypothetical protein